MVDKSHRYFITLQLREVRTTKIKRKCNKQAVQVMLNTKSRRTQPKEPLNCSYFCTEHRRQKLNKNPQLYSPLKKLQTYKEQYLQISDSVLNTVQLPQEAQSDGASATKHNDCPEQQCGGSRMEHGE